MKNNKLLVQATPWMVLKGIMVKKKKPILNIIILYYPIYTAF